MDSWCAFITKLIKRMYLHLNTNPGEGNGKPLQYSGLENPMDGGKIAFVIFCVSI